MEKKGMGWVPDYPDVKDCTLSHERVQSSQKGRVQNSDVSERTDERFDRLLKILQTALPDIDINNLTAEVEAEIDYKIHFLSATFASNMLSLESEGKAVEELQNKLKALHHYYRGEPTGYFDQATEEAVKAFQTDQLIEPVNGVVTVVTRAQLLALAAIAGGIDRGNYFLGDFSPVVIYIQQLLQNSPYELTVRDPVGVFGESTHEAVLEFQAKESLSQDGIVGPVTKRALDRYRNQPLNFLPSPPVPRRLFNQISEQVYDLVVEQEGGLESVIEQLDGVDAIDRSLCGGSTRPLPQQFGVKEKIQRRLQPLTEVLIQLAPCLNNVTTLPTALKQGYKILKQVKVTTDKEATQVLPKLKLLIDRLERSKGYVASSIFRHRDYKVNDSGPAVIYIQERLRALGYYNAPTTGYFEQLTKEAVIQFQKQNMTDAANAAPPDGIFNCAAMEQLYDHAASETFHFLESPVPALLVEGIIRQFGGLAAVLEWLEKDQQSLMQPNQRISAIADKLVKELKDALPGDEAKLKVTELSEVIASPHKSELDKQEAAQQFILLMTKLAINPIVQVIAHLVAPIGKYSDLERACEDGVRRFKVFANFSRVREIDRILKGISPGSIDDESQLNQYELLAETLATIQVEAKQYERSLQTAKPNTSLIDLSRSLVIKAIKAVAPPSAKADSTFRKIQEFLLRQIYVNVKDYVKPPEDLERILDALVDEPPQTKVVRDQTFIRVVPSCNACLLQVPIAGKLYKSISRSLKQFSSFYLVLPSAVDLSLWCSPVEDQGCLDACTAHAGVALVEYFQKKRFGNSTNASRRFLYKTTRNLMHRQGDTGASVRETMKAMVLFGIPPEEYCPYSEDAFDDDPSAFCYAFAQNFQTITYFRLDDADMSPQELLAQIKTVLVAGFPCMFGFTVYDSIYDKSNPPGHIPYPDVNDKREGGHAAIAVGYSDYKQIKNAANSGALLIKNSWGVGWGDRGYGWLPYDYVLKGLARDWWSLVKAEWVETEQFGLGSEDNWTASIGKRAGDNL